jgi:SAM-dependent methyltransferase
MHKGGEEWFRNWFDSPYSHLLYQHRDEEEARFFLDHLLNYLNLPAGADILDIPCGKGRHAVYLESKGFHVTGMDLSSGNISMAQVNSSDNVQFYVHDMRQHLGSNIYHCIFNLFTSLGYFKWEHENYTVIRNMALALKPGGHLVIDFFNSAKLAGTLHPEDTVEANNITFHIKRRHEGSRIVKSIWFNDGAKVFSFEEDVMMIKKEQFEAWFLKAGLEVVETFGTYDLRPFQPDISERLIFVLRKA